MSKLRRFTSHSLLALAEAGLIALLVVGLVGGTALAGKGGARSGSGGGTVTHYMPEGDQVANYGERVQFTVATTATDRPFVGLRCYQGDAFVLDGYTGYFPSYTGNPWITLGSPYWDPAQSADCTARLFYYGSRGRQIVLATETFVVYP